MSIVADPLGLWINFLGTFESLMLCLVMGKYEGKEKKKTLRKIILLCLVYYGKYENKSNIIKIN